MNLVNIYTKTERGVSQWCVFPSDIFNLYIEAIGRNLDLLEGYLSGANNLNNISWADDRVLITDTEIGARDYTYVFIKKNTKKTRHTKQNEK